MFIDIKGTRVHYEVSGAGQPILLLHGWGANLKTFQHVHKFLEPHFKVYSIDFPGFGESHEPPETWSVYDYADFLADFLKSFEIENPILVGHSFGGRVSIIHSGRKNPVKKLILVDSAGIKPKRKLNYYVRVYTYKFCRNLLTIPGIRKFTGGLLTKLKSKFGSSDYKNVSGIMQQTFVKVVNEDLQHFFPNIEVPTLLVWGDRDDSTPVSDGELMEKKIPDAGLVVLKNAGHYSFLDKQHEFLIIIDKFLEKEKGGA